MKSFAVYGRMGHATDKQRQYEFVSVSMLRLTDGHLVGRSWSVGIESEEEDEKKSLEI